MVEGARLESVYAVLSCIGGSNPPPSATNISLNYSCKHVTLSNAKYGIFVFALKDQYISGSFVLPLFEGGKGIGVTNGVTAGAWAAKGAVGTFSAVNADFYDDDGNIVVEDYSSCVRRCRHDEMIERGIRGGIAQAQIAHESSKGNGRIHMNVLWEMGGAEKVLHGILEKASNLIHGVTCGAGLPYKLAEIAATYQVYYYPIVSSVRAFKALYMRSYSKVKELLGGVVYEDPWRAGGHNGLSNAESPTEPQNPYMRIVGIRKFLNEAGLNDVPIIIAGGVWWLSEWVDYLDNREVGNVCFQFGTRPLLTKESPVLSKIYDKVMSLKEGDVQLTALSPTGFYSSAIKNKMLSELMALNERVIVPVESSAFSVSYNGRTLYVSEDDVERVRKYIADGFSELMIAPDDKYVFVSVDEKARILRDRVDCVGCLSRCRFSGWSQDGVHDTMPDPRSFCIQKSLQNFVHGGSIEDNLFFAGHGVFRFAQDPFYNNGFVPSVAELIDRIMTGF